MHKKGKIRRLINLEEKDGKKKSIVRLKKRYSYLKSKRNQFYHTEPSRQMKYINFHLKRLGAKA